MEQKKITFDSFIRGVVGCLVAVCVLWVLYRLSDVLLPFFVAWLLAYLIFPLVRFFQFRCRLRYRVPAVAAALISIMCFVGLVFWLVVPPVVSEMGRIRTLIIEYVASVPAGDSVPALVAKYLQEHVNVDELIALFDREELMDAIKQTLPRIWNIMTESVSLVFSAISLLMTLLYTIFILLDYESLSDGWVNMMPKRFRPFFSKLTTDIADSMNHYFRGQAIVATCVGVLFSIGFLIIGFPMAIVLGMFIGLLNMVPYLQVVGFIPTIVLAIIKSGDTGQNFWVVLGLALIVFAVVQVIQDMYLTPRIMGRAMGLSPAIILLSLSVWGSLMGIMGMIIALPITTLLISYYQKYVIDRGSSSGRDINSGQDPARSDSSQP